MKVLNKALTVILAFCSALALTGCTVEHRELPVLPAAGNWTVEASNSGEKYLHSESSGEKILKAFCYDKLGNLKEISLADFAEIKNQTPTITDSLLCSKDELKSRLPKISGGRNGFTAEGSFTALGIGEKISADYNGVGSFTIQPGDEYGFIVSSTSSDSSMINGALISASPFEWNTSLPVRVINELSVSIPEGKTAYVRFEPYLNIVCGTVSKQEGTVWGISPLTTASGGADGLLEIVLK